MRWFVVAVAGALAIAGFLATRVRRNRDTADVGSVSDEWVAQHRATAPEAYH